VLYLEARGLGTATVGAVLAGTMVEDALLTMLLSAVASRLGPARVMAGAAPLIAVGGLMLAAARSPVVLIFGAILGTLSPNGQEAGPFAPMEQALLPDTVRAGAAVRAFSWYNFFGFVPAAAGAGAAGVALSLLLRLGFGEVGAYRPMLLAYAGVGVALALLYSLLALEVRRTGETAPPTSTLTGLHRSRRTVLELAGLQAIDALGGGLIIQSLLAYWFRQRFAASPGAIGSLFLGTNLLSAVSFFVAARIAERLGLLRTMVFTHLPSNLLLMLVPLMPSFPAAAAVLLGRHLLSQMDVPTRQAYTAALVDPDERPAAAGFTASARALAQGFAPLLAGLAMSGAAGPEPFLLAGALKVAYDLSLLFRFRGVRLPGSDPTP
jgi:MFS family permease